MSHFSGTILLQGQEGIPKQTEISLNVFLNGPKLKSFTAVSKAFRDFAWTLCAIHLNRWKPNNRKDSVGMS